MADLEAEIGGGVVRLRGEMAYDAGTSLRGTVRRIVAEAESAIVDLDLGEVTFLDSSGVGALVAAQQDLEQRGHQLRLVNVPAAICRRLELFGMTRLLEIDRPGGVPG